MQTVLNLVTLTRASVRLVGVALSVFAALLVTACGGDIPLAPRTTLSTPTATPAPGATSTPGPASLQATLTGDAQVSGPLVAATRHFVTCDAPSLKGTTILAFENAADRAIGVLLTVRASSIQVRLAENAGNGYTARLFEGSGVTSFDPLGGARFSSSLTETTPPGANKGRIGSISSISGSVSCGTFTPGSASVTVTGDTPIGSLSAGLTSVRVLCGANTTGGYITVSGLGQAGSNPVVVSLLGGVGGATFYVVVQTASAAYQFRSTSAGIVTLSAGAATYKGTATEIAASPGSAGRSVTVSGSATCGT